MLLDILSELMWLLDGSLMCHFLRLAFPLGYNISLMENVKLTSLLLKKLFLVFLSISISWVSVSWLRDSLFFDK